MDSREVEPPNVGEVADLALERRRAQACQVAGDVDRFERVVLVEHRVEDHLETPVHEAAAADLERPKVTASLYGGVDCTDVSNRTRAPARPPPRGLKLVPK